MPGTRAYRSAWDETIAAAEEANQPGRFTAFIGYEWTSNTGGNNLHRVVVYRDGADKAGQVEPYTTSAGRQRRPQDLWRSLAAYEEQTGGQVLAIAHNGNLSNGRMFPVIDTFTGAAHDRAYAETRARWEPLYEVTQIKGDGETHPFLSPNDEFADFESWDAGNLDLSEQEARDAPVRVRAPALQLGLPGETAGREPLPIRADRLDRQPHRPRHGRRGQLLRQALGQRAGRGARDARLRRIPRRTASADRLAAGRLRLRRRLAREKTRAALFDAMQRKEAYATTGPRMVVRLFGGLSSRGRRAHRSPAIAGYSKGVPMGGDLGEAPRGRVPTFLVAALKDPIGANLDRIQIVKGWLDAAGQTQEKVFDVAWSGDRRRMRRGECPR